MCKHLPKIFLYSFLIIFIFQLASLLFLLLMPAPSQAGEIKFKPQVEIGEFKKSTEGIPITGKTIGEYIRAIYKYAIGIVGILATVVLMFGGILWIVAGGNAERVGNAKSWIGASLTGLILVLCSYMVLKTVNPALVEFKPIYVEKVEKTKQSPRNLSEGSVCTPNQPPFCDYGLECKNNKCVKTTEMQQASQSGMYRWQEVSDCSSLGKINYGDTFCPSPKPGINFNCCGKY